jgi:NitT/TauT family transport system substrate-binding protein
MKLKHTIVVGVALWVTGISLAHAWLNLDLFAPKSEKFKLGYIPVTCHLTCPVTDFVNKSTRGDNTFEPMRFNGFPEIKEMFINGRLEATFILAPLAMQLREQGVPIKVVYLGHRDGSALVVNKGSSIYSVQDLRGKKVAIPSRSRTSG